MSIEEILKQKSDEELLTDLLNLDQPDIEVIYQKLLDFNREHLWDEYLSRFFNQNE